jgi:hypothetical protein
MPLSDYEQRVLEQMEQALTSDDPRLANTLQSAERHPLWRYVVAFFAVVAGLLLLVVGAASSQWVVGIIGFVVMFGGVMFALVRRRSRGGPVGVVGHDGSVAAAKSTKSRPSKRGRAARKPGPRPSGARPSFMARLEERWDRRRGNPGL